MEQTKNKILIIGSNDIDKHSFVERILKTSKEWTTHPSNCWKTCRHIINTKYYSAEVEFWVHLHDNISEIGAGVEADVGETTDALLMLFTPQKSASWARVCEWSGFVEKYQPSTLLCVACHEVEVDRSEYVEWCIDRQVEFVSLAETRPPDADEREKYGEERVLEALQNNMWQNMQRKTGSTPTTEYTLEENPNTAPNLTAEPQITNQFHEEPEFKNNYLPLNFFESFTAPDGDFDFEQVVHTIKSLKEQASHLPDEERRALAASVALSFAKLLGEDDEKQT